MSKNTIMLANSFAKDLKKLPSSLARDHQIDLLRKKLYKNGQYLPYWRNIIGISYNKHDTLVLAKALCDYKPDLSLYQAKLIISNCPWYDYHWFNDYLIKLNNPQLAKEINLLFEYIYNFGKTHYLKSHSPEYEKALNKWFDEAIQSGTNNNDGSFTLGSPEENPILIMTEDDRKLAKKEVAEETHELGQLITNWIKQDQAIQTVVMTFLRVWAKNYRKHSFNANWRMPTKQMSKAYNNIKHHNWNDLPTQFANIAGWWD